MGALPARGSTDVGTLPCFLMKSAVRCLHKTASQVALVEGAHASVCCKISRSKQPMKTRALIDSRILLMQTCRCIERIEERSGPASNAGCDQVLISGRQKPLHCPQL